MVLGISDSHWVIFEKKMCTVPQIVPDWSSVQMIYMYCFSAIVRHRSPDITVLNDAALCHSGIKFILALINLALFTNQRL